MHGIIFNQLQKFVRENHGPETLSKIKEEAGVGGKFYDVSKAHPDEDIFRLIDAACKVLNVEKEALLEAFGNFIAPGLLKTYQTYIKPEWNSLDLLEHVETTMHKVVRISDDQATPPELVIKRISPDEVEIKYYSKRKMVSLGIGIIKAIATHYKENLSISKVANNGATTLRVTIN